MRFAILGDLHYSDYPDPEHAAARDRLFTTFFQQVAALDPELVFAVGDTTNLGTPTEMAGLQEIAQKSSLPLIRVTGNHDCYSLNKSDMAPFFLGGRSSLSEADLYTHFDVERVRFVLTDTAREKDHDDYGGFVSEDQLNWLAVQIKEFNTNPQLRHLIVLGHHPIHNTTDRSTETMLNIANSEAVSQVFTTLQRKPGFYFCGHNHSHSIYGQQEHDWIHVQTADPLDCQSFRLVTLSKDTVEIDTIQFDLGDPDIYSDFETTRQSIPIGFTPQTFEVAYGSASDHRLSVYYPMPS